MSVSVISKNTTKIGTCPHGFPLGACPICNGMGGGGAKKQISKPENTNNQWSYMKCVLYGQMLENQKARAELSEKIQNQLTLSQNLAIKTRALINNINIIINNIKNSLPVKMQNSFQNFVNKVITPILNIISKLPQFIQKIETIINDIKSKLNDLTQKLTAFFGEIKNFIKEKVKKEINKIKRMAKKFLSFFISEIEEEIEEDEIKVLKSKENEKINKANLNKKEKEYANNK